MQTYIASSNTNARVIIIKAATLQSAKALATRKLGKVSVFIYDLGFQAIAYRSDSKSKWVDAENVKSVKLPHDAAERVELAVNIYTRAQICEETAEKVSIAVLDSENETIEEQLDITKVQYIYRNLDYVVWTLAADNCKPVIYGYPLYHNLPAVKSRRNGRKMPTVTVEMPAEQNGYCLSIAAYGYDSANDALSASLAYKWDNHDKAQVLAAYNFVITANNLPDLPPNGEPVRVWVNYRQYDGAGRRLDGYYIPNGQDNCPADGSGYFADYDQALQWLTSWLATYQPSGSEYAKPDYIICG